MRRIVFWQNALSIHLSAFLCELAKNVDIEVAAVAQRPLEPERMRQGWSVPKYVGVETIIVDGQAEMRCQLSRLSPGALNVVGGFRSRWAREVIEFASRSGGLVGLMAEGGDPRGLRGDVRRWLHQWELLSIERHISFLLAMGSAGVDWYRRTGFPEDKICEFWYCVGDLMERGGHRGEVVQDDGDVECAEILFVGSLIRRKGVDLLISALCGLHERRWRITVVGDGPLAGDIGKLQRQFGPVRVKWIRQLDNMAVRALMAKCDVLVLPSRFDGWGAVVSEALSCGTSVICSDSCGASCTVSSPDMGKVVPARSVRLLRDAIETAVKDVGALRSRRQDIATLARRFDGQACAKRFMKVVNRVALSVG